MLKEFCNLGLVNLREKADHPNSGPKPIPSPLISPPPPPAQPTDTDLSSISEKQAEPGGGAFEEIRSNPSSSGKEKADLSTYPTIYQPYYLMPHR